MKRTRLRSVSKKRRAQRPQWDAVYRAVDERAGSRCEVVLDGIRCPQKGRDHHHTRKPRSSFHAPEWIIKICREHHNMVDRPIVKGRLMTVPMGDGTFDCSMAHRGSLALLALDVQEQQRERL